MRPPGEADADDASRQSGPDWRAYWRAPPPPAALSAANQRLGAPFPNRVRWFDPAGAIAERPAECRRATVAGAIRCVPAGALRAHCKPGCYGVTTGRQFGRTGEMSFSFLLRVFRGTQVS